MITSFEKRHKNMTVHCAPCWQNVKEGDIVTIGQCRPLSKTVRFNVLEHEPCINTVSKPSQTGGETSTSEIVRLHDRRRGGGGKRDGWTRKWNDR